MPRHLKIGFLAVLFFAFNCAGYSGDQNTWSGFVTDIHCGTNCQRTSAMTPDRAVCSPMRQTGIKIRSLA
jgi:hypothetical protein